MLALQMLKKLSVWLRNKAIGLFGLLSLKDTMKLENV